MPITIFITITNNLHNMPRLEKPTFYDIKQLKGIADFQFGSGAGDVLFPKDIMIERSRSTKRIKIIYLNGDRLCSFRCW